MTKAKVVVLDYGSGNVRSACRALARVGAEVELSRDAGLVQNADGLVVPGVGAFGAVMEQLRAAQAPALIERRLAGGRAVLGICVGMQVMFSRGVERGVEVDGLQQWPGTVELLPAPIVPHMGWAKVQVGAQSRLFAGIENERFYFVHSYGVLTDPGAELSPMPPFSAPVVTWGQHGAKFVAAIENGALAATQFHPEKSGDAGAALLENWLGTLG